MKRIRFIYTFIVFGFVSVQGQKDTLRLFYAINETQSAVNLTRVDSLIKKLNAKNIQLKITGYADYLHDPAYNLQLSKKRADLVKDYLLKNYYPVVTILYTSWEGEKYSKNSDSREGEAFQRRVDVVLVRVTLKDEVDTRPVTKFEPVKNEEIKKEVEELNTGESLVLEGLSFIPGRHTILPESKPILKKLLNTLLKSKNLKIEIQGHVCCPDGRGEDAMDYDTPGEKKLSVNRAKAIYEYLIKNGVAKERLTYKGFGYTKPRISPETTPEEEQMNRRVEIVVLEK